jgi:hypothetical protein
MFRTPLHKLCDLYTTCATLQAFQYLEGAILAQLDTVVMDTSLDDCHEAGMHISSSSPHHHSAMIHLSHFNLNDDDVLEESQGEEATLTTVECHDAERMDITVGVHVFTSFCVSMMCTSFVVFVTVCQ